MAFLRAKKPVVKKYTVAWSECLVEDSDYVDLVENITTAEVDNAQDVPPIRTPDEHIKWNKIFQLAGFVAKRELEKAQRRRQKVPCPSCKAMLLHRGANHAWYAQFTTRKFRGNLTLVSEPVFKFFFELYKIHEMSAPFLDGTCRAGVLGALMKVVVARGFFQMVADPGYFNRDHGFGSFVKKHRTLIL